MSERNPWSLAVSTSTPRVIPTPEVALTLVRKARRRLQNDPAATSATRKAIKHLKKAEKALK